MLRPFVASQLPETWTVAFANACPEADFENIAPGPPIVPAGADILIAAPFPDGIQAPEPSGWPFTLRWVEVISVGLDSYPPWLFNGSTVTVMRGISSLAVAEYALAAIFSAAKRLPEIWIKDAGAWRATALQTIAGKTLGLFGFGSIGKALAARALALGMNVIATRHSDRPFATGVERVVDLAALMERSDHLVLVAPATAATNCVVNAETLSRAKPGLHLVNVSRGALIDDSALLEALDRGQVSLATLDVAYPEPLPGGHPFYHHSRVRLSPHTSAFTSDSIAGAVQHFAENLLRFRHGRPLADAVDFQKGY